MYRIMIVEDDLGISQSLKKYLDKWGFETKCVEDFGNVLSAFSEFLSTMVPVMISSTLCLYVGKEENLISNYPREIEVSTYSNYEKYTDSIHAAVDCIYMCSGADHVLQANFRGL